MELLERGRGPHLMHRHSARSVRRRLLFTLVFGLATVAALLPDHLSSEVPEKAIAGAHAGADIDGATKTEVLAVADAYVRSDRGKSTFGGERELVVEGRPVSRAYLRFHPRLPGRLVQATLRIFVTDKPGKLTLHRASAAWGERTLTYRKSPAVGVPAGYPEAERRGWLEFDVTSLVELGRPFTIAFTRTSPQKLTFASREARARAPRLLIETDRGSAPVVAAAGDVACGTNDPNFNRGLGTPRHCRAQATYEILRAIRPTSILGLGDSINALATYEEILATYDRTWGRLKPLIRPVPGDWEYSVPGGEAYFRYFGAAAGDPKKGYFSYNVGSWHIVALNSSCRNSGGCLPTSPQAEWLRSDLAANAARCTLAYVSDPRFSSTDNRGYARIDPLWRVLAENGAELLLAGGAHHYERFAPMNADGAPVEQGLRQIVVGTGGHSFHDFATPERTSEVRSTAAFGVLRLTLGASGYDWRFVAEAGQTVTDSGTASCH
jgi:acid phosphatase type 7